MNSVGLGDLIESALSSVGITSGRIERWLAGPCGCEERKRKLNAVSAWARRVLSGKKEKAREHLGGIIDDQAADGG